jgi:hypothetical protein
LALNSVTRLKTFAIGVFVFAFSRTEISVPSSLKIMNIWDWPDMAVAGIGGISGKGQPGLLETGGTTAAQAVAALSIAYLLEAIQNGKSESEIRALAHGAGYAVVIT